MMKEFYYAMNGGSPQIGHKGNNANVIFRWEGSEYSGVATADELYRTMGNIGVCIEFELLEVNVPIDFLATQGFSLRRDAR
jgi:hypothetical protein